MGDNGVVKEEMNQRVHFLTAAAGVRVLNTNVCKERVRRNDSVQDLEV